MVPKKIIIIITSVLAVAILAIYFVIPSALGVTVKSSIDMGGKNILNLREPSSGQDYYAATKGYVDSKVSGLGSDYWTFYDPSSGGGNAIYANNVSSGYVYVASGDNVYIGSTPWVCPSCVQWGRKLNVVGEARIDGGIYARDSSGVALTADIMHVNSNNGIRVFSGGKVGIGDGSFSPSYELDLYYCATNQGVCGINAATFYKSGQELKGEVWKRIWQGGVEAIYYNSGEVGINKGNPYYDLDIDGSINGSSFYVNGSNELTGDFWNKSSQWSSNIYFYDDVCIGNDGSSCYLNTLKVRGSLAVSGTKNFVIDHPTKLGIKLVHATLEGPEAAVFYRGEGQLQNGQAVIELPDYFEALTRKEGRTILVTPVFYSEEESLSNLSVGRIVDGKFQVWSADGVNSGQRFYWEVKAVRADVPILEIETLKNND